MLLVLNRTRTDRDIGKYIGKVAVIFRIQHLIGCRESIILDHAHMKLTNRYKSFVHIRLLLWIRLMKHSLVSAACGTRLICVYTRYDNQLILNLLIYLGETAHVLTYSVLAVRGARSNDHEELFALSRDNIRNLFISCRF